MEPPIEVFLAYSPADQHLCQELLTHLAPLEQEQLIHLWHRGAISAGTDWQQSIDQHLNAAPLILLLISSHFLASRDLHNREIPRALERHQAGEARLIPIILRPTDWMHTQIGALAPLPLSGRPITNWSNRDTAWLTVVEGLRTVIAELTAQTIMLEQVTASLPKENASPRALAKIVLTYLEDRQILFAPHQQENASFCLASANATRQFLTLQLAHLALPPELTQILRTMRGACRTFMRAVIVQPEAPPVPPVLLNQALDTLRATMGYQGAQLADRYNITGLDSDLVALLDRFRHSPPQISLRHPLYSPEKGDGKT